MYKYLLLIGLVSIFYAGPTDSQEIPFELIRSKHIQFVVVRKVNNSDGMIKFDTSKYFLYNKAGRLTTFYHRDGIPAIKVYAYDKKGRLSEITSKSNTGALIGKITWKYNKNRQVIEENKKNGRFPTGQITYFNYDDKNRLSETYETNKEGRKVWAKQYEYWQTGELREIRFFNIKKKRPVNRIEQYDIYGNIVFKEENGIEIEYPIDYELFCQNDSAMISTSRDTTIEGKPFKMINTQRKPGRGTYVTDREIFDAEGILTLQLSSGWDTNGNIVFSNSKKYNKFGRLTEFKYENYTEGKDPYYQFNCEYAENSLPVKMWVSDENGKILNVSEIVYGYFEK